MSEHLEELRRQYPGQIILTPEQIAKVLGSARQTIYNQVNTNSFPIRPIYRGRTWGCSIVDIARFLDTGVPQVQVVPVKSKPGRKPSPRPVLKYQMVWDDDPKLVETDNPVRRRSPSANQVLKYQEFWSDVLVRMKNAEQKLIVIRETPPREIR